ncbi:dickkopf-related protein 1 [Oncorhynchus kisutch]|uniref:Dickkopf-related protein 1 n=1 Tax=Oncorhynchus kisutch TaxID=8019 RepID=A0A8C7L0V3_ONCKI|nr:dickkopf-related protein 1 [Oncorhynchus kisutch]
MPHLSVLRFMAVYLMLFGYLGDAYAGAVLLNSNAIKNLPGGNDTVSPSPRPSSPDSDRQKAVVDTLQLICTYDDECGTDEFCNDIRGACLPCRKIRKRCARDSVCCAGNRCINGVCQASDQDAEAVVTTSVGNRQNNTMEHHGKRLPLPQGQPQHSVKGRESDNCLRSSDCSEGLCCARHFWSRICKPVLTKGQVCTRHRRKGGHGLELFQRCDCGGGLSCRPERGEKDPGVSRTADRNLHTCQRRGHTHTLNIHTA